MKEPKPGVYQTRFSLFIYSIFNLTLNSLFHLCFYVNSVICIYIYNFLCFYNIWKTNDKLIYSPGEKTKLNTHHAKQWTRKYSIYRIKAGLSIHTTLFSFSHISHSFFFPSYHSPCLLSFYISHIVNSSQKHDRVSARVPPAFLSLFSQLFVIVSSLSSLFVSIRLSLFRFFSPLCFRKAKVN